MRGARRREERAGALALLQEFFRPYRAIPYGELRTRVDARTVDAFEVRDDHGRPYLIEVAYVSDDRGRGDIRVIGSIDARPVRPLLGFLPIYTPLASDDFILAPDGSFVGEEEEGGPGR